MNLGVHSAGEVPKKGALCSGEAAGGKDQLLKGSRHPPEEFGLYPGADAELQGAWKELCFGRITLLQCGGRIEKANGFSTYIFKYTHIISF